MNQSGDSGITPNKRAVYFGLATALGAGIGTALGVAAHNLALGVGVGVALFSIGLLMGAFMTSRNRQ
jgi:hypothetical protein